MIEVRMALPGTREMWLALHVDDVGAKGVSSSLLDDTIVYTISTRSVGEAKSVVNDILRCYAALKQLNGK